MSVKVLEKVCPQNHACPAIKVCPKEAITQKNFELPIIDKGKCISCMRCVTFCPMNAIIFEKEDDNNEKN